MDKIEKDKRGRDTGG
jgi:hypothetical protein